MTTTSPISDDMDMTKWSPEQRLSFYEDMFFGWRLGLSSFDELPLAQRRHIVARCLEDMATLGCPSTTPAVSSSSASGSSPSSTSNASRGRDYPRIARHLAAMVGRAPLLGRVSTVVDGTGVGRAFTDMMREAGVAFTPVTITGGSGQSRGDNGYGNVSKMVLLSELAAHLESGRLRIINTPMGQELNSFEVDFTSAGNTRVDVRSKDHHGDLVIATALALWAAVGRSSGRIEVGKLENYW